MPIYEYECRDCKRVYEVIQRMSDAPVSKCPGCGYGRMEKLVSAAAVIVKEGSLSSLKTSPRSSGLTLDAVPDDFRHPTLGLAASRIPGK